MTLILGMGFILGIVPQKLRKISEKIGKSVQCQCKLNEFLQTYEKLWVS